MNKLIAALALLALTGCATCREHPVACRTAGFLAVSALAISLNDHGHREESFPMSTPLTYPGVKPVNCTNGACK